jgi:hypothetical protein
MFKNVKIFSFLRFLQKDNSPITLLISCMIAFPEQWQLGMGYAKMSESFGELDMPAGNISSSKSERVR